VLCRQQTPLPGGHQASGVQAAFPGAHPGPPAPAPRGETARTRRGKTQSALSTATKSKAVQLSSLIKLLLFFPLLLFWFLSLTPIYSAEPTHHCSARQPWHRGTERARETGQFGGTELSGVSSAAQGLCVTPRRTQSSDSVTRSFQMTIVVF